VTYLSPAVELLLKEEGHWVPADWLFDSDRDRPLAPPALRLLSLATSYCRRCRKPQAADDQGAVCWECRAREESHRGY
jgi:hypothetical protein